ncbi:MAG TPA: hypothetical protein VN285_10965 [Candidatus Deferrimicrobium sp.]|nr:hypothetical protein [Candidatus Deferrimicrobium sp.]
MDAPVIGAEASPFLERSAWRGGVSWRYQRSFRHFVGSDEQIEREEEGSQVINSIHLADVWFQYGLSDRMSLTVSVPYLMATRSLPIRDENRVVIGRSTMTARALSDITVVARRWMKDPVHCKSWNVQLGLGVKLPTGPNDVLDTRTNYEDSAYVTNVQSVDQSIQPGDGGFGFLVDMQAFRRLFGGKAVAYLSGTYLSNPENTNGVLTYRSRASEAVMSVADQYVLRAGAGAAVPGVTGLGFSLGGRVEGVPAEDLIGSSDGFRRPGYAVSIEPLLSLDVGAMNIGAAVPIALYRNRVRSVSDRADDRHGDAAFADYLILVGVSRRLN